MTITTFAPLPAASRELPGRLPEFDPRWARPEPVAAGDDEEGGDSDSDGGGDEEEGFDEDDLGFEGGGFAPAELEDFDEADFDDDFDDDFEEELDEDDMEDDGVEDGDAADEEDEDDFDDEELFRPAAPPKKVGEKPSVKPPPGKQPPAKGPPTKGAERKAGPGRPASRNAEVGDDGDEFDPDFDDE